MRNAYRLGCAVIFALVALSALAQQAVLYTGSDWCDADVELRKMWQTPSFRQTLGMQVAIIDEPEVVTEALRAEWEALKGIRFELENYPGLAVFDAQGRCVLLRQGLAWDTSEAEVVALVREGEQRAAQIQALLAQETIDGAAQAIRLLLPEMDLKRTQQANVLKAAWDQLKRLDPQDKTGIVAAWSFNPQETIYKVQDFAKKGDFKGGEAYINGLLSPAAKARLSVNQQQGLKLHTFVLYRHEKNHHQANVALLREVVAMDPTTHFGQGAQGMLKLMGEAVGEEMNVRPQPLALKPRIGLELQAKKPLTINKTIPVYAYASLMLSPETIETIRQRRGGTVFLERFFSDQTWAEDFFGSGPAKPSWDACFLILEEIAWQVPLTDRGLKKWATAAALNAGEGNRESVLRLMVALADIRARKLLVRGVEELPVGLLRYVVTPGQTTAEELLWLAKTHNVPPRAYSGVCWYAPYRLDNFFGDSIHGAHYYVPWDHAYNRREASRKVGGVCGSLSYYGSLAAKAHGLPSTPGGQPAHCAYSLFVPSEKTWWLCYNVNPYTGAHFQMWHYSFDYLPLAADLFLAPSRKEALRLFWKAEVARLRSEPAVVRSPMTCKIYANWNERTLPKSTALPPLTREDKNVRSFTADQGGEGLLERTLLVWNGTYEVKRPTEVRFTLASDDGADLTLDGKVLITNDGCHGMSPAKEAVVLLAPGKHPFEVRYFNYGGGRGLSLDATPTVAFSIERMAAFARAARKAPAGYDLFVAWEKWLAQAKGAPTEAWITFAEAVAKGLANHPRPAWDLLSRTAIPAIQKAKGEDALVQQLAAWHGIIRQDDRPVAEFCDFAAILKQQATLLKTDAQKLTLFRGALSGQFDTRDAFGIVMRWGGEVFLKEDGLAQQYVAIVSDVLREKGAAADMGNFLDGAIRKASEAGNLTAFQRLSDLCDTLRPPASRQPLKLTFTQAPLLSDKGLLRTSTTSNWDQPGNYRAVIDGQTAIGNFHTASESAPWAEVELPGMADISAVYIENIHTQNNSRAVPFNVTISQNGKDWKKVANATTSQETWQFTFPPVKGRFVRVTWTGNADAKTFLHFRKFTVHGKKLY